MQKEDREEYINKILESSSPKKIVVGGPGTGKTYLFERVIGRDKNPLTLTFINALVEDLSLELYGISTVKTLHSFAQKELSNVFKRKNILKKKIKISPNLPEVIKEDAKILLNREIDFDKLFHNKEDDNEHIDFYKKRKNYYEYYGYSDVIYGIVKMLEKYMEEIPHYDKIIIDEFQDFNKLEVALIDLLSQRSPILIVGDDDQALYKDTKDANPEYIRQRFYDKTFGYSSFYLPYCSRCTRVIIDAVNDIINTAKEKNFLKDRIEKPFEYFNCKDKNTISDKNPKIIYSQEHSTAIPYYIQENISNIAKEERKKFSVLIISPFGKHAKKIASKLKEKGFENVDFAEKRYDEKINLLEGLKILLEDKVSNLGWRIISRTVLTDREFETLLKESYKENAKQIKDIISKTHKKEIEKMLKTIKAVLKDKEIDKKELEHICERIEIEPCNLIKDYIRNNINSTDQNIIKPGLRKIPIKITTIHSSKGLSSDYVFITHFDDKYFIENKDKKMIRDQEICNFVVSLTRARKKVFLISTNEKRPTFLDWIKKSRVEENNKN